MNEVTGDSEKKKRMMGTKLRRKNGDRRRILEEEREGKGREKSKVVQEERECGEEKGEEKE